MTISPAGTSMRFQSECASKPGQLVGLHPLRGGADLPTDVYCFLQTSKLAFKPERPIERSSYGNKEPWYR